MSPVLHVKVRWRKMIFFKQYMSSDYIKTNNEELIFNMKNIGEKLIIYWLIMTRATQSSSTLCLFFFNTVLVLLKRMIFVHQVNKVFNHFPLLSVSSCSILHGNWCTGEMSVLPALSALLCIWSAALWHYLSHHRGREQRFQPHCADWPALASPGEGVIWA